MNALMQLAYLANYVSFFYLDTLLALYFILVFMCLSFLHPTVGRYVLYNVIL